jgi:hypothetical protein
MEENTTKWFTVIFFILLATFIVTLANEAACIIGAMWYAHFNKMIVIMAIVSVVVGAVMYSKAEDTVEKEKDANS